MTKNKEDEVPLMLRNKFFSMDVEHNIRSEVIGLIVKCPWDRDDKSCPIHEIRKLPILERYSNIKKMPLDKVKKLLTAHTECVKSHDK